MTQIKKKVTHKVRACTPREAKLPYLINQKKSNLHSSSTTVVKQQLYSKTRVSCVSFPPPKLLRTYHTIVKPTRYKNARYTCLCC